MSEYSLVNIVVLCIGLTQATFAGIMILIKKNLKLPDKILAVWLFAIALQMLISLFNTRFSITAFPISPFIYAPLMYIYIRTLIDEKPKLRSYYIAYILPAIAIFILAIIYRNKPILIFDEYLDNDPYRGVRFTYAILLMVSIFTYSILTFINLNRHRKKIRDLFSYTSQKVTLGWALFVSISFFVIYIGLFAIGFTRVFAQNFNFDPLLLGNITLVFYSFAFSIFGYQQDLIYPPEPIIEKPRYVRSGLKPINIQKLKERLIELMDKDRLYQDPELSILEVAQKLRVPRHHVTQILNEELGKNFYTFINEYRIEDAKQRLKNPKNNNLTVLAIGYDAGFNSKSSFNTLFKKFVGMTPSEYRAQGSENHQ
ncbi:MAG: helix-turn-helix domain-containing protein [Candidatus Marinimicrobia bacterium]|nr:helix-turn-helix domain-containing protein [Candidatus Neomarinimicrobiota bacterium]